MSIFYKTIEGACKNSRKQKKALMQQLLTGKKRFKEFEGEKWREVKLSEIAEIVVSNVDKKVNDNELPVKLCNYTDVYYNEYITNDVDFMKATAKPEEIKKFTLKKGDVLITKDSESPDDIAIPALVNEEIIGVLCGYHLAIVRPCKDVSDGGFISCLFALSHMRYHFGTLANGATRFGLPLGAIKNAKFLIPSLQEQKKIAEVIEGINNEIQNLVSQKKVLNIQKKTLMQQLLTGKRRVVTDNPIPKISPDLCEVTG